MVVLMKLKYKISIAFIVLIILTSVCVTYISFYYLLNFSTQKINLTIKDSLKQTIENVDYRLKEIERLNYNILTNKKLESMLMDQDITEKKAREYQSKFETEIFSSVFGSLSEYISSVYIIGKNGVNLMSTVDYYVKNTKYKNLQKHPLFRTAYKSKGKMNWYITNNKELINKNINNILITGIRSIQYYKGQLINRAFLVVNLKKRFVFEIFNDKLKGLTEQVLLSDEQGKIINNEYKNNINNMFSADVVKEILNKKNGSIEIKYLNRSNSKKYKKLYFYTSTHTGWKIITVINSSIFYKQIEDMRKSIITFLIIILLIAIIIAGMISRSITLPLDKLMKNIYEVKKGNLDVNLENKSNDEIQELTDSFNKMTKNLKRYIKQIKLDQKKLRKMELKALQAQINPHFLYNTLDSIYWMTKIKGNDEAAWMITSLSRFFRLGLNKGRELYTIKKEVNHVKNYLQIQQLRCKKKFEYYIEIDDEIKSCESPKIILQPLVENSILHGFKNIKTGGIIRIKGWKQDDKIILEIKDNGSGINIDTINEEIFNNKSEGYALHNVQDRIVLTYGKNYGLHFNFDENKKGRGTRIQIWLPYKKWEGDDDV